MIFPEPDSDGATRLTSISLSAVALIVLSIGSYMLFSSRNVERGARRMHAIEVIPKEMAPGQTFKVRVSETMYQLCPFEIRWSLISSKDHIERLRVVEPQKPAHPVLGEVTAVNNHFVPSFITPGDYIYSTQVFDECPGRTYVSTFTAPFLVIKGATDVQ